MDLLNQVLILAVVSAAPWVGGYLHKLAPSEVAFARTYLQNLLAALLAVASFLAVQGLIYTRWVFAILAGYAVFKVPSGVIGFLAGVFCALAIKATMMASVGTLIIVGIILGSLHPKTRDISLASGLCYAAGVLVLILL